MNHSRNAFLRRMIRQRLALSLCLFLCLALPPSAMAEDDDSGLIDAAALDSWMEEYVAQNGLNGDYQVFSVGFCYTGTGDFWFWNADQWMYSASLYKVPVSMLLAEKEAAGELTQDTVINNQYASGTLAHLESTALTFSNNDSGHALVEYMGGSYAGKCADQIVKFTSLPESYFTSDDFKNLSYYTARFMTHVMKTLYDGGEEAFPHVIEYLLDAQPDDYYNSDAGLKGSYAIAQKYGAFVEQNGNNNNHCAAIIYTPTPVIVVVMTKNVGDYQRRIAEVGSYLAGYALELNEKKAAQEQEALALAAAQETEATAPPDADTVQPESNGDKSRTTIGNGTSQAESGSAQNNNDVALENATDAHIMLTMIAAVVVTGMVMLAVGLAAEASGRSRRRKGKK